MSNKRWLDNLVWTGAKTYLSEEMKPWSAKVDGSDVKAGDTKTAYSLGGGKISKSAHAQMECKLLMSVHLQHLPLSRKQDIWVSEGHVQH